VYRLEFPPVRMYRLEFPPDVQTADLNTSIGSVPLGAEGM
jgi:hypothetical protein